MDVKNSAHAKTLLALVIEDILFQFCQVLKEDD